MKKAFRTTAKKMRQMFVRNKSRQSRDETSTDPNIVVEGNGIAAIEQGLEVEEGKVVEVIHGTMNSVSQDMYVSSDEDDNIYIVESPEMDIYKRLVKKKNWNSSDLKITGCMPKEKKQMLDYTSVLFWKKQCKGQVSQKKLKIVTENNEDVKSTLMTENYSTWPSSQLQLTIQNLVLALTNKSDFGINYEEIEHELNLNCPLDINEQLDFCMMCHEDHLEAAHLQRQFCLEYDLVGKVVWDCVPLGIDLFTVFENVLNNSTKLLFYLTERFDDANACAYLARNLLMSRDDTAGNMIPIVSDFQTPIPETFQLVDKLYLCSKLQFQYRFPAIFTPTVRKERLKRTEEIKKMCDEKRILLLKDLLQRKIS